jgi:hypothetical protein
MSIFKKVMLSLTFFLILYNFMFINVYSQLGVTVFSCPYKINQGERETLEIIIDNPTKDNLTINNFTIVSDIPFQNGSSSTIFMPLNDLPETLKPHSEYSYKGYIGSNEIGIHYLDLFVSYHKENSEKGDLEQKEICKFEVLKMSEDKNPFLPISNNLLFSSLFFPGVVAIIGWGLKRYYTKKDIEFEIDKQHGNWFLEQYHDLALKYYLPLATFAKDSENWIEISHYSISGSNKSINISKETSIRKAFSFLCLFLIKYREFHLERGSIFIFHKAENDENLARRLCMGIIRGLPFDINEFNNIIDNYTKKELNLQQLEKSDIYSIFAKWIISAECNRSKELIRRHLRSLYEILFKNAERLSKNEFDLESFLQKIKVDRDIPKDDKLTIQEKNNNKSHNFFFIEVSKKSAFIGDEITIAGNDFANNNNPFVFVLGSTKKEQIQTILKNNYYRVFTIPNIEPGIYDLFAIDPSNKFGDPKETLVIYIQKEQNSNMSQNEILDPPTKTVVFKIKYSSNRI